MAEPIRTERLDLVPVDVAMLDALLAGDAEGLGRLAGADFGRPLRSPPLFGEHAGYFRDRLRERGGGAGDGILAWRFWFLVERTPGRRAVGVAGLPGEVEEETVRIGYSIYPEAQGNGYATEAVEGLVAWLLTRPEVRTVQATIAPENAASLGVARKVGMDAVGTSFDDEGELIVFERRRPAAPAPATAAAAKRSGRGEPAPRRAP